MDRKKALLEKGDVMGHKCYISFKFETEDREYKRKILEDLKIEMIDKSLHEDIPGNDDTVIRKIRENYIADSTVTIFLIGQKCAESEGSYEQRFIKRELQASLYNGSDNPRSGILGIVLPSMYYRVYTGESRCSCGEATRLINVNDTTIKEFSYNYFIPNGKCHFSEDDRYCVMVKWDDFVQNPEKYIDQAFEKRSAPIANKVKVRPE